MRNPHPLNAVTYTAEKVARLKRAYVAARKAKQDSFTFEGHEYLTSYAHYLLEFLETKLS
jgi:hypothetical protein